MKIGLLNIAAVGETPNYALQRIPIKKVCDGYYLRWYYNGWHYWFFLPGTLTVVTEGEKYRTIGTRKIAMGSGQVTRGQVLGLRTIMYTREVSLLTIAGWMNIRIEPGTLSIYDNQLAGAEIEFIAVIGSKEISYGDGYTPVNIIPVVPSQYVTCEVVIGTQIWACKNYDSNYPASKVYNDDEANRIKYGGLYTYLQIMSSGFVPAGWHVPTLAEWKILIDFVGNDTDAGGILKEKGTTYWNPGIDGTNDYSFGARGGGHYPPFADILVAGYYWTATEAFASSAYHLCFRYNTVALASTGYIASKSMFASVRLIKDTPAVPFNDWFLPSKDELNAMYTELVLYLVGNWINFGFWTSSEYDADQVWWQSMQTGVQNYYHFKNDNLQKIRACRTFTTTTIYNLRDQGPAGGWIFHIINNGGGSYTYYECSPENLPISANQVWSNFDNTEIGITAQGIPIGTGQANTTAIIAQHGPGGNSAAKLCNDLIVYH
jgi:uncharacterized protein (TIGR02145 family)